MQKIIKAINEYKPTCEQEEVDKKLFLQVAETIPNSLTRESTLVHFTTSAFVINKQKTKLVSAWHNIYKSWAWLGGHNDGDDDFLRVVLKEIQEESGLKNIKPFTDGIFAIESLCVLPHTRKGAFVPAHIHLNAT
ncbi:MAG: NUDIX hydrolase [Christensenellaceae bacterium]|jgi:hypothetical protein|nr:NUDIX hydrolase [Christensenellaceae bacterium]